MSDIMPSKHKMFVDVTSGVPIVKIIEVPKYGLKQFMSKEGEPIFGTEVFFEGKNWFPVVYGQKTKNGWGVPADFQTDDDVLFWCEEMNEEEMEYDIQNYFIEKEGHRAGYFMRELRRQSLIALKKCFAQFIEGGKIE